MNILFPELGEARVRLYPNLDTPYYWHESASVSEKIEAAKNAIMRETHIFAQIDDCNKTIYRVEYKHITFNARIRPDEVFVYADGMREDLGWHMGDGAKQKLVKIYGPAIRAMATQIIDELRREALADYIELAKTEMEKRIEAGRNAIEKAEQGLQELDKFAPEKAIN